MVIMIRMALKILYSGFMEDPVLPDVSLAFIRNGHLNLKVNSIVMWNIILYVALVFLTDTLAFHLRIPWTTTGNNLF